ncbi:carbohydrate ABC transporter, N-acetylglucosamine/diacetylchitobiose-binding protein [Microbacterium sp. dk485]|uniref:Carbohydrate ABC transporter, N-acetylglucosamine/diacetylchitobiose-binding protein n=1 Tax=Microbacterium wangchenii TaxID=2541726 RepID=A0ABX5SZL2_9MICO|nr:N-acetylglucosamine/diacetylchitobiose ABC transporter substrate-binding protein [Microbacterium sp. EYE_512]QBR90577.1 carbohydrate ABC transporter, N-acetylglucosamine/diacetylchitobiose-binding protein [Microbacterium wangchenii]TFV85476.1 carbohydrate ABC transporter, N-acetylglucosamine/diacetylchitobiose-binding protein [Microbacterium sp. dk485]TXK09000.1 carbohydrate ABC transporter, N-acetylglucosamine/diacetylchitobiose-binding protein [Microbacterium wangchenii]
MGAASALALTLVLSSCAGSASPEGPAGEVTADNPFGLAADSSIEAVVFEGGYGIDYVSAAGEILQENFPDVDVSVSPSNGIAQELQPRFVGGDPPDLFSNDGAAPIPTDTIIGQLEPLDDLWDAENLDGVKIADAVFPSVRDDGTYGDKFVAANYVMTVIGLWYSSSLLEEHGWEVPHTWDELLDLGAQAKEEGLYLFTFGKEAANYYEWMMLDSAIKEGGLEVIADIANLEPDAWSHPAVVEVYEAMEEAIAAGYMMPGGAGTQFTQAQAQWSQDQGALFYPSGSWIENEMKDATAPGFDMTVAPFPTVTSDSALPYSAVQAGAGVPFEIPADAENVAGAKELLRTMLSKEAASHFSETTLAPTIVKDTVPADGFGSTALASTMSSMENAGDDIFNWVLSNKYFQYYGIDHAVPLLSFLSGDMTAKEYLAEVQAMSDKVAADASVDKVEFTF